MSSLLALKGMSKSYGSFAAVSDVEFEVAPGERLAIIGPNGAGKSTLFGVIAGEHKPTKGSVQFLGRDVTSLHSSQRAILGMSRTFQVARLMESMTVRENVFLAALTGRREGIRWWDALGRHPEVHAPTDDMLELAGLHRIADTTASKLAQGDRKTLEMAMAIVQEPELLLLDEPTAGMGYDDARAATRLIKRVLDSRPEMTIVVTAHDMDVIHALAERVILMARGRIVLEGTPAEVSAHSTTKELYLGRGES